MKKKYGKLRNYSYVKNKMSFLWERYFVLGSVVFIILCFVFYGWRFVYFYKIENPRISKSDTSLISAINNYNHLMYKGDGLYTNDEVEYYFKGNNINNYVNYSGRLFRVIGYDDFGITLITSFSETSIAYGTSSDYDKSYAKEWLNSVFLPSIYKYQDYLVEAEYCVDSGSLENIKCENKIKYYVGLLDVNSYLKAGGLDSYLNNETYFFLGNGSVDNNVWYVFPEGGINDLSYNGVSYYSYGIRPVIKIRRDVNVLSGDGSINSPFVVDTLKKTVLKDCEVGSYFKYGDYLFRILNNGDTIKLVMNDYYLDKASYSDMVQYLNNEFYNSLDKSKLEMCTFNTGSYGDKDYDYRSVYSNSIKAYVYVLSVGDLFTNDLDSVWLANNINSAKQTNYTALNNGSLYSDLVSNSNYIRPVICVNKDISISGNGYIDDPYVMESK